MNKTLLYRTYKTYLLFSVIVLVVAAPLFYYAIKQLYIREADKILLLHKNEFLQKYLPGLTTADIELWNRFNRNIKIDRPGTHVTRDSLFSSYYYDVLGKETGTHRILNIPIQIEGKPYTYVARINLVETEALVENIALLFLVIILALLVGLFIITKRRAQSLWEPFYKTLGQIEDFEIDKSKQPVFSTTDIKEFNRLNTSIEKLIGKNTLIYKSQAEFIENAAHELQTPLAVFQAKIDTLMQGADFTKEQAELMESLNDTVSRLNRVNKNLLLLSKIDNDHYSDRQSILLADCIEKNIDFFTEQATAKKLKIQLLLADRREIKVNPALADIFISNLFLNAVKHNIPNGQITVSIQANKLVFSNSGKNFPLNPNKLYNRFSKEDPSGKGTGLGLSIIKKIADLNGWTIDYDYAAGIHSFIVTF